MQGFTNFERREYCYEEGCARGACVKVRTLTTKRLNARRREIDRRAFFVLPSYWRVSHAFRVSPAQTAAISVCREISVSRTQPSRLRPSVRKIGPELSDSLFSGASRVNTEFSFGDRARTDSNCSRNVLSAVRLCGLKPMLEWAT